MHKVNTFQGKSAGFVEHFAQQFCASMISRGEVVKKAVQASGIPIARIAKQIGVSRGVLYMDFTKPAMSFDRIIAIGKVIGHDFSEDFKDLPAALVHAVNGSPVPSAARLQECQATLLSVQTQLIAALQELNLTTKELNHYRSKYGAEPA